VQFKSIVMINCGGIIDIKAEFELDPELKCYVVDSHRPTHLSNVHNQDQIILFDDNCLNQDDYPSDHGEEEEDHEEDDSEDEDSEAEEVKNDSDGEAEMDPEKEKPKEGDESGAGEEAEKAKEADKDAQADGSEGEADDDEDEDGASGKRKREDTSQMSTRRFVARSHRPDRLSLDLRRRRRRKLQEYYRSGSYFGAPAASLFYELASQLNKDNNNMLWLAILGATDFFLNEQISPGNYNSLVGEYQKEVCFDLTSKKLDACSSVLVFRSWQRMIKARSTLLLKTGLKSLWETKVASSLSSNIDSCFTGTGHSTTACFIPATWPPDLVFGSRVARTPLKHFLHEWECLCKNVNKSENTFSGYWHAKHLLSQVRFHEWFTEGSIARQV
jgi:hypothetical protein